MKKQVFITLAAILSFTAVSFAQGSRTTTPTKVVTTKPTTTEPQKVHTKENREKTEQEREYKAKEERHEHGEMGEHHEHKGDAEHHEHKADAENHGKEKGEYRGNRNGQSDVKHTGKPSKDGRTYYKGGKGKGNVTPQPKSGKVEQARPAVRPTPQN